MKSLLPSIISCFIIFPLVLPGQTCNPLDSCFNSLQACQHGNCGHTGTRYLDAIFEGTDITISTKVFACVSDSVDPCSDPMAKMLRMTIFQNENDCVCCYRPVVLFAASGGFTRMDRNESSIVDYCLNFARRGFVTATFDYRTGYPDCCQDQGSLPSDCLYKGDFRHYEKAVYRAQQDASSAIRYLKSRAASLGIDSLKIAIAGSSSGGTLALHTAFAQEGEQPTTLLNELGPINKYGIQAHTDKVAAAISLWGSIKETEWLKLDRNGDPESVPLLMYHGTCDASYRYDEGIYQCFIKPDTTTYKVSGPAKIRETITDNSLPICFEVHTGCGFTHGMQRKCMGNPNIASGHVNQVIYYIQNQSAEFLYDNMLNCSAICTTNDGYLLKPCYCGWCQVEHANYFLPGCSGNTLTETYGMEKPCYLNLCGLYNQTSNFDNWEDLWTAIDSSCDTLVHLPVSNSSQQVLAKMMVVHSKAGHLLFRWSGFSDEHISIAIFNLTGKKMWEINVENNQAGQNHMAVKQKINPGVYLFRLTDGLEYYGKVAWVR